MDIKLAEKILRNFDALAKGKGVKDSGDFLYVELNDKSAETAVYNKYTFDISLKAPKELGIVA